MGQALQRRDLAVIDHCVTHSWDVIQAMDAATFESSVFETFEIALRYDLTLLYIYII